MSQPEIKAKQKLLNDRVTALITAATELADNYRLYEKAELPLGNGIDIDSMETIKREGLSHWRTRIGKLDSQEPTIRAAQIKSIEDGLNQIDSIVKKEQQKYSGINEKKLTPDQLTLRYYEKLYDKMSSSIPRTLDSVPKIPSDYANDKELEEDSNKARMHKEGWSRLLESTKGMIKKASESKGATDKVKIQTYKSGIVALEVYDEQFNQYKSALFGRIAALKNYDDAIVLRNGVVNKFNQLLSSKPFKQIKTDVDVDDLRNKIAEVSMISKKDYMKEAVDAAKLNKKSSNQITQSAIDACNNDVSKINDMVTEFNRKIENVETRIKEKAALIDQNIEEQYLVFKISYDSLLKELTDQHLNKSYVQNIEQFNNKLIQVRSQSNNQDPLALATQKRESVMNIVKEFTIEQQKLKGLILDAIHKKVELVEQNLAMRIDKFLSLKGKYILNPEEERIFSLLATYKNADISNLDKYQEVITREARLIEFIPTLEQILKTHDKAIDFKNNYERDNKYINKNSSRLNDGNIGTKELIALKQYFDEKSEAYKTFIADLSTCIAALNSKGLQTLRDFNQGHDSPIKQKLDLLDLAQKYNKITNPQALLNNENAIGVLRQLDKSPELHLYITQENLSNDSFCTALLKLKDIDKLTPANVEVLLKDERKRNFINEYNSANDVFLNKELIKQYLNANKEVVDAFNNFKEEVPTNCKLLLLNLIIDNKDLQALLTNKDNLQTNVAFLRPLFKDMTPKDQNFLDTTKIDIIKKLKEIKINKENPENNLKQMGEIWQGFNQIIHTAKNQLMVDQAKLKPTDTSKLKDFQTTRAGLNSFQLQAIPILLNDNPIIEKKKQLEVLADTHLKQTSWYAPIIEYIGKKLGIVSETFFSKENVAAKKAIDTVLKFKSEIQAAKPKESKTDADNAPSV